MSVPIRCLATLQRPVFLVNSRYPPFTAASRGSMQALHPKRHPFSRSYGANLPSSLARVISSASGYSPNPRVFVYGTVTTSSRLEVFLGSVGSVTSLTRRVTRSSSQLNERTYLSISTPKTIDGDNHRPDHLPFCVTSSLKQTHGGAGI